MQESINIAVFYQNIWKFYRKKGKIRAYNNKGLIYMANHKSALKRVRQTKVKTERNRFYKTRIKNLVRKFSEAIEAKNEEESKQAFKNINKSFHKFVSKGIFKKNTASRKVSNLHSQLNKTFSK